MCQIISDDLNSIINLVQLSIMNILILNSNFIKSNNLKNNNVNNNSNVCKKKKKKKIYCLVFQLEGKKKNLKWKL